MEPRFLTPRRPAPYWFTMTATTPTRRRIHLDRRAVGELERTFRGQLVGPDDMGYREHRRVWNGSIDRYPALIARCVGVADVLDALGFARRTGLAVAVRSGGHSFPGLSVCDDGLVIDLSLMKGSGSTRSTGRSGRRRGSGSENSTGRPRPSDWPCRPAS
jgi:FAD binding domain